MEAFTFSGPEFALLLPGAVYAPGRFSKTMIKVTTKRTAWAPSSTARQPRRPPALPGEVPTLIEWTIFPLAAFILTNALGELLGGLG